jgi:hypothetical protein
MIRCKMAVMGLVKIQTTSQETPSEIKKVTASSVKNIVLS